MTEPGADEVQESWKGPAEQFYTNVLMIAYGPFDVTLVFGQQDTTTRTPEGDIKETAEVARITMSWAHAKSMIPLLARMVAKYEEQVGQVPAPGFDKLWKED